MEQQTEEWFEARLGKATASRFKDVLSKLKSGGEAATRANYRAQLVVERLTGVRADSYSNSAMQWGIDNEALAVTEYELLTGNVTEECGFIKHKTLEAGASPDRLVGEDGILEVKCPNTATHIAYLKAGKVPMEYIAQVMGQLWITGRKWCDFISYDPRMPANASILIVRVYRDESYIDDLEAQVEAFLDEVEAEVEFVEEYEAEHV